MFHMVMGFVQGTKYGHKDEDGHLVTSLDGYNSYLVIVDRATRYTWYFFAKPRSLKSPPLLISSSYMVPNKMSSARFAPMVGENSMAAMPFSKLFAMLDS